MQAAGKEKEDGILVCSKTTLWWPEAITSEPTVLQGSRIDIFTNREVLSANTEDRAASDVDDAKPTVRLGSILSRLSTS